MLGRQVQAKIKNTLIELCMYLSLSLSLSLLRLDSRNSFQEVCFICSAMYVHVKLNRVCAP